MTIKFLSILVLTSAAFAQAPQTPSAAPDMIVSARARQIHDSAIIVDTHADTPQRFLDEDFDIGSTDPKDLGHISLDKARARKSRRGILLHLGRP